MDIIRLLFFVDVSQKKPVAWVWTSDYHAMFPIFWMKSQIIRQLPKHFHIGWKPAPIWSRHGIAARLKKPEKKNQICIRKIFLFLWKHQYFHKTGGTEMVFCFQNCSDLLWEKIVPSDQDFFLNWGGRPRICQTFEITRTIRIEFGKNNLDLETYRKYILWKLSCMKLRIIFKRNYFNPV